MSQFSAVDAATEGFRLMGRKPGTIVAWVLAWLILACGPIVAMMAVLLPHAQDLLSELKDMSADGSGAMGRMLHFQMTIWSVLAPWMLWMFVAQTILSAAIFRAVLEPRDSAFAYLRLGMDEVRLFLLQILLAILWTVFFSVVVGACIAVVAAAHQAPSGAAPWIDAAAIILAIALLFYVPIRLSLAAPMTFALKRIEVFGSWRRTRGRFWALVLMLLVVIVFAIVVGIGAGVIQKLAMALLGDWTQMARLQDLGDDPRVLIPAVLHAVGPGLIAVMLIQAVADVLMRVVGAAPFAAAYRDLGGAVAAPAAGPVAAHA